MSRLSKYRKGTIIIEAQSMIPEKFINLLWKNNIEAKNIYKKNITTIIMEIKLQDYDAVEECSLRSGAKIRILERKGLSFFWLKFRKRTALVLGVFLFIAMLYYLSTFIWGIDIETDKNLSPYEIRQQLYTYGIKVGVNKGDLNVFELENKFRKNNDNIMYISIRPEGSRLKVKVSQNVPPPQIITDDTPCNLVAKRDGEISRVFTSAGTAMVKSGAIVKKGQLLVKGEQGKEGNVYQVHAKGEVVANTFYESIKEVVVKGVKKERTGKFIRNYFIEIGGKQIYIKNTLNNFKNYDRIVDNKLVIKEETIYEVNEVPFALDAKVVADETSKELYNKLSAGLSKSIKIKDKIVESEPLGNSIRVRVAIIAEENIALEEKIQ